MTKEQIELTELQDAYMCSPTSGKLAVYELAANHIVDDIETKILLGASPVEISVASRVEGYLRDEISRYKPSLGLIRDK